MGNIELFNQNCIFIMSLASLGFLFLTTLLATGDSDSLFKPIWLIFLGIAAEFAAEGIISHASEIYSNGGNVEMHVLAELLLLLTTAIFMVMAAISMMVNGIASYIFAGVLGTLGLAAVILFGYITPDGTLVDAMRRIFPMVGFACVALGFWAKTGQERSDGFGLGALATSIVTVFILLRSFNLFADSVFVPYVPMVFYLVMSLAFIMIKSGVLNRKLDQLYLKVEKFNARIEEMIRLSPFPILMSRLGDDKIILANNNACKLFGINAREMGRYHLKDFFADAENRKHLNERLEAEKEVQDFEILVTTPNSEAPFWLLASANVIDYNNDLVLYSAFQDITSRKNRENMLAHQATRDPLTSLYNRRYFEEEVAHQIAELKEKGLPYTVMMLDADFFKKVNDTYGHKTGDKVLIELGSAAVRELRDRDIVARYGGEEFVIFLPEISIENGAGVAERLRQIISEQLVLADDGTELKFTVSVGVSSSDISDDVDVLVKTADEALYKAKQNGRNRVEVFSAEQLSAFLAQGETEHKDASSNHHPVFDKENKAEISLLDGQDDQLLPKEEV